MSELLMAVLIMSLMTLVLTSGINASTRVYNEAVTYSEKRVLLSTLSEAVMAEIRNGTDFEKTDDVGCNFTFTSKNYGSGMRFSCIEQEKKDNLEETYYVLGLGLYSEDGKPIKENNLLGNGSYINGKISLASLGSKPANDSDIPVNTTFYMNDENEPVVIEVWLTLEDGGEFRHFTVSPMTEQQVLSASAA